MSDRRPKFCERCGAALEARHDGERERAACPACGFVAYGNPTPVVAALVETPGGILLARGRGWPAKMFGLVAGFLEAHETPETGVLREVKEELGLDAEIVGLIGAYAFDMRNEVIIAYHVRARGEPTLGEELEEIKRVPPEKLRGWDFGTGLAVKDWVARRGGDRGEPPRVTVDDLERVAASVLPKMAYDYFRSGADEERTLARNRDAFAHYEIVHRVLTDVRAPQLATTLLGEAVDSPIHVAPTAYHLLAHPDGEAGTARAAHRAGCVYVASTLATTSLEDVAAAAPGALQWFQLYVHRDWAFTARLVERAKGSGYRAVVVTLDTPVLGRRVADVKNGFALPEGLTMANLVEKSGPTAGRMSGSELARYVAAQHDAAITEETLRKVVEACAPLPVVVKGVVRPEDARRAIGAGARAVWVSNHGGRQLDLGCATIDALADVSAAVGADAEVYVDGGVRSGTHAMIALARGARAVFVGRPVLWALAAEGEAGVSRVLAALREELVRAMQLAGCQTIPSLRDGVVRRRS